MSWDDDATFGDAQQFTGGDIAPWQYDTDTSSSSPLSGIELAKFLEANTGVESTPAGLSSSDKAALFGNEGYGEGMSGAETTAYDTAMNTTGSGNFGKFLAGLVGGKGGDILSGLGGMFSSKAGIAALLAYLAARDRQKPTGGGTTQAYAGYQPMTRTMTQGPYGPIARYAADGGMMRGYAHGGPVAMEDGGFVMTKKAVDGAGGPQGIQQLVPGARMIRGPGTGTSDSVPAYIQGPSGRTPAAVSNGEAYVPKRVVDNQGGARQLYALMNQLQRKS